jgi:anaerobic selenocysteine-containing dehydrogenase
MAAKGRSVVLCRQQQRRCAGAGEQHQQHARQLRQHHRPRPVIPPFKQGDDAAVAQLVKDMNAGTVGALLIAGVNPAYSLPNAAEFKAGLAKVGLTVSFSGYADETASLCNWICPDHHYLESWNDLMPKVGHYALAQPAIRNLFDTRQWQESLLLWSGSTQNYHDFIRSTWDANMTTPETLGLFTDRWNQALHDGVFVAAISRCGSGGVRR